MSGLSGRSHSFLKDMSADTVRGVSARLSRGAPWSCFGLGPTTLLEQRSGVAEGDFQNIRTASWTQIVLLVGPEYSSELCARTSLDGPIMPWIVTLGTATLRSAILVLIGSMHRAFWLGWPSSVYGTIFREVTSVICTLSTIGKARSRALAAKMPPISASTDARQVGHDKPPHDEPVAAPVKESEVRQRAWFVLQ